MENAVTVMLAVDGSEHSDAAVSLLRDLPLPPGSQVQVVSVLTRRHTPGENEMQALLKQTSERLARAEINVGVELLSGHPAEELTRYANTRQPDLLVVGAKGLHATLGVLLGGVAQQVVEYANRPVLVVRAPYRPLRKVMLLVDGSPCSTRAAEYLGGLPLPADAELRVLTVMQPLPLPDMMDQPWASQVMPSPLPAFRPDDLLAWEEEERAEAERVVREASAVLEKRGKRVTGLLLRGNPAPEVLAYAREQEIDLIVAGSRGLSQVRGWLLGSLSRKLIHYAGCSVLIVK